jgi:hypothetical protein
VALVVVPVAALAAVTLAEPAAAPVVETRVGPEEVFQAAEPPDDPGLDFPLQDKPANPGKTTRSDEPRTPSAIGRFT